MVPTPFYGNFHETIIKIVVYLPFLAFFKYVHLFSDADFTQAVGAAV